MKKLGQTILWTFIGFAISYYFDDEIKNFPYHHILFPFIGVLIIVSYLINRIRSFKHKVFISSRFDIVRQVILLVLGSVICAVSVFHSLSIGIINWILLSIGILPIISSFFFQKSIQLYLESDQLIIEYVTRGKFKLDQIDSYEIKGRTLKVYTEGRKIEVYDLSLKKPNIDMLKRVLSDFKVGNLIM